MRCFQHFDQFALAVTGCEPIGDIFNVRREEQ